MRICLPIIFCIATFRLIYYILIREMLSYCLLKVNKKFSWSIIELDVRNNVVSNICMPVSGALLDSSVVLTTNLHLWSREEILQRSSVLFA